MFKGIRVSLANKCQLLFGLAVVLILTAALSVVWLRMETLVERGTLKRARDFADAWLHDQIQLSGALSPVDRAIGSPPAGLNVALSLIPRESFDAVAEADAFLAEAIARFVANPQAEDAFTQTVGDPAPRAEPPPPTDADDADAPPDPGADAAPPAPAAPPAEPYFRYARALRASDLADLGRDAEADAAALDSSAGTDPLEMVLLIHLRDTDAATEQMLNRIYIVAAGLFAGLLAIAVFWFITTRLILSPVRLLRGYAQKVSEGDLNIRSDINTGDEFEQLSDMFNTMLESLKSSQDEMRSINKSLDLKLGELAESNVALYEANKIKGEFLANVSHELRTPLNSIAGFAEVLQETLADRTGPVDEKRKRYAANIIQSSRRLLDLINDLLDLAKIEAGRMELRIAPLSIADTAEGLVNLIRPQAEKGGVALRVKVPPDLPLVRTDPGKLQQILFNFLANAVKFTPPGGTITLAAAELPPADPAEPPRVRLSVSDTGKGIAPEDHQRVFDKFTQLDPGVTKAHGGTGLGLTISQELAHILQGRIDLDSDLGRGATFSLVIPVAIDQRGVALMPEAADHTPDPAQPTG